jgi:hypothetical protein
MAGRLCLAGPKFEPRLNDSALHVPNLARDMMAIGQLDTELANTFNQRERGIIFLYSPDASSMARPVDKTRLLAAVQPWSKMQGLTDRPAFSRDATADALTCVKFIDASAVRLLP